MAASVFGGSPAHHNRIVHNANGLSSSHNQIVSDRGLSHAHPTFYHDPAHYLPHQFTSAKDSTALSSIFAAQSSQHQIPPQLPKKTKKGYRTISSGMAVHSGIVNDAHYIRNTKRRSAVELLAESKSYYVKSENVLDKKQLLYQSMRTPFAIKSNSSNLSSSACKCSFICFDFLSLRINQLVSFICKVWFHHRTPFRINELTTRWTIGGQCRPIPSCYKLNWDVSLMIHHRHQRTASLMPTCMLRSTKIVDRVLIWSTQSSNHRINFRLPNDYIKKYFHILNPLIDFHRLSKHFSSFRNVFVLANNSSRQWFEQWQRCNVSKCIPFTTIPTINKYNIWRNLLWLQKFFDPEWLSTNQSASRICRIQWLTDSSNLAP